MYINIYLFICNFYKFRISHENPLMSTESTSTLELLVPLINWLTIERMFVS